MPFMAPVGELLLLSLGLSNWTLTHFLRNGARRADIAMLRTTLQISISVTALAFILG